MFKLGPIPDQSQTDVGSVLRGAEERHGMGQQLRLGSLAHPGWPYAGTAHAWRRFVGKVEVRFQYLNFGQLD